MKILTFDNDSEGRMEWLAMRRGKITGSRLKDIVVKRGTEKKIGFYQLIAEKLGLPADDDENAMERGARLEKDAIARFEEENPGVKVDTSRMIWTRDDNENIAVSPDGVIDAEQAVEVKCLSSARHIEAYLTKEIPPEYEYQALQYFIVNDELETLHFVFFDPRFQICAPDPESNMAKLDYFEITVRREDVEQRIEDTLTYERQVIAEVNSIVNKLTF
jgi:putative phage-type endonuclease